MGLREQKKLQTRQSILDTANRLFRERGYEATRVIDIIEPVQISKKTFFNYFPSKEAVLQALAQDWFMRHATYEGTSEALPIVEEGLSPINKLKAYLMFRLETIIRDREFVRTLVNHTNFFSPNPKPGAFAVSSVSTNYSEILDLIKQAQHSHEIRTDIPAEELNEIFIAARNAAIIRWLKNDSDCDLKQQIENVLKVILKGFQAD